MDGVIADSAGGAWTFGGSILTFAFPMILFVVVATALYVLYTKPEFIPGHWVQGAERPVSYTSVPGKPAGEAGPPAGAPGMAGPSRAAMAGPAAAQATGTTNTTGTSETAAAEPADREDGA